MRPNELFSGRNHGRHLCRDCAHLPAEEREHRQGERDIERLLRGTFHVPRKRRAQVDRFLEHPNARVRDLARRILDEQRRQAEELRRMRDEDEARAADLGCSVFADAGAGASDDGGTTAQEPDWPEDREDGDEDDEGPFW
jgi:hypothetical protein